MDKLDRNQFVKSRNRRGISRRIENQSSNATKISIHNILNGKLFTKEFLDRYLKSILRRTLIAVAILLCVQVWDMSKVKIAKTDVEKVREVIHYNYTWDTLKETFEQINYDKIIEVWNEQGE
ncbi:MAG: hypothetical protein K0R15_597 [Clostridiales bacterium]|jgi:hypothetical protein|nr:hypothetical protein [Clostridiales bacterium]